MLTASVLLGSEILSKEGKYGMNPEHKTKQRDYKYTTHHKSLLWSGTTVLITGQSSVVEFSTCN